MALIAQAESARSGSPGLTRGQVFNIPNHNQVRFVSPGNRFNVQQPQSLPRPTVGFGVPSQQQKGPVIKLVPAPDLSKVRTFLNSTVPKFWLIICLTVPNLLKKKRERELEKESQ